MTTFYLGSHRPGWLNHANVPLFVSHQQLRRQKTYKPAIAPWSLDSGGFTEISTHGEWTISAREYIHAVRRYRDEIGRLDWAAPQDWMCEPFITAKTGKTVDEHQRLTIENYLQLRTLDAELPIIPVLQGWHPDDYQRHADQYEAAGIELGSLPLVGVGSVCRRQDTGTAYDIFNRLNERGIQCHGFGVKLDGLRKYGHVLASADSMAWSYGARRDAAKRNREYVWPLMHLPECGKRTCANCLHYAMDWRDKALNAVV